MPTNTELLAPPTLADGETAAAGLLDDTHQAAVLARELVSRPHAAVPTSHRARARTHLLGGWLSRAITVVAGTAALSAFAPTEWLTWGILALAVISSLVALLTRRRAPRPLVSDAPTRVRVPAHRLAHRTGELYSQ